jgi:hypothetical protein
MNKILLSLSLLPVALASAQSIVVDGDQVNIDAGNASVSTGAANASGADAGAANVRAVSGSARTQATDARVRAKSGDTNVVVDGSSETGASTTGSVRTTTVHNAKGDRSVHTEIDGSVVNRAVGPGASSEQTIGDETRVDGHVEQYSATTQTQATTTITRGIARSGRVSYVNAQLDATNFSGKQMPGVAFTNASLVAADFRHADLQGADFTNADLSRALLQGANLHHADITNAELGDAQLDGARWIDGRTCGPGSRGSCR